MSNANSFVKYVQTHGVTIMTKAEWDALFYLCFEKTEDRGSSLIISNATERRLQKNSEALKIECVDSIPEVEVCDLFKFIDYIENRGFEFLTKTEWQQTFFYYYVKSKNKEILKLSIDDIYDFADEFNITFSQCFTIVKKCYSLCLSLDKSDDFSSFFSKYLSDSAMELSSNKECFLIEISNPIVLELFQRLLRKNHVLQDYSFNKNVVNISFDTFSKLLNLSEEELSEVICNQKILDALKNESKEIVEELKSKTTVKEVLCFIFKDCALPIAKNVIANVISAFISVKMGI